MDPFYGIYGRNYPRGHVWAGLILVFVSSSDFVGRVGSMIEKKVKGWSCQRIDLFFGIYGQKDPMGYVLTGLILVFATSSNYLGGTVQGHLAVESKN